MSTTKVVGLFVDVSNLYFCVNKAFPGKKINYGVYRDFVVGNDILYCALACGTQNNPESLKFETCLNHLGYETIFRYNQNKNRKYLNTNVIITIEVLKKLPKIDEVILGTSDPDFVELVSYIKELKKSVRIVSCGINHQLKKHATSYEEITENLLEVPNVAPDSA
jgi:uncharacterized LabA/DUF88 family protein